MRRLLLASLAAWVCCAAEPWQLSKEDHLRENARLRSQSFEDNHRLGEYYIGRQDLAKGIAFLERAAEIDPANYPNSYDLALAYLQNGMPDRSREVIKRLMERSDTAELHVLLGDVEESQRRFSQALQEYDTAARLDPSEKNLFDLGSALLRHGAYEPAGKVLEIAVKKFPSSARVQVGYGIVAYSLGQYDLAVTRLCRAVDLDPADGRALEFLGKMYDISSTYAEEVTRRLKQFVRIYPGSAEANYYYAVSLRKRTESQDSKNSGEQAAERYLGKAIRLNPKFSEAHYALGVLYEDHGRLAGAILEFERARQLDPSDSKVSYRLARLYQKSGQLELASREFKAAALLKRKPSAP